MKIRYEVISDVGRRRSNNEDMALLFGAFVRDGSQSSMVPMRSRPRFTALIADGMGGYGGGEIASEMTLQSFNDMLAGLPAGLSAREVTQTVKDWFRANNRAVIARGESDPALANMGTTLTGIFTYGDNEFMVNAGDSRVYRWRYETLRQLTVDHSERERTGDLDVPSNLIYNAVGVPGAFVDVTNLSAEMPVIDGDTYIICSDGLCDMVTDKVIADILSGGGSARELVDAALDAGGLDNCTVIVLSISIPADEEPAEEPQPAAEEPAPAPVEPEPQPASDEVIGKGFDIDEIEPQPEPQAETAEEPAVAPAPEPTPPPLPAATAQPAGTDYEEITEEEAMKLPPATPTAGERVKIATTRLRKAWDILRGKEK